MTVGQIKDSINELSEAQVKRFNQTCESKLYNESNVTLSQVDQDYADDLAIEVDALNLEDFETLQDALSSSRKLSKRPC